MPPAVEAWSLNHWTTREVPLSFQISIPSPSYTLKLKSGENKVLINSMVSIFSQFTLES